MQEPPGKQPTSTPSAKIRRGALPDRLGPYLIEQELARGGMGAVYIARHADIGRRVALKVMLGTSEAHRRRFLLEAQATAKLRHPNIVAIHDAGEDRGTPYLAMDLVEGESLAQRIERQGALDERVAAELALKIALGIAEAHKRSILHRDLKPANVLINAAGEPLVTDFGLAKDVEAAQSLTKTGQVLGTPAYMPPEQATGDVTSVGPHSDVYSIGATLYEMLTGEKPFGGEAMNVMVAVVTASPERPAKLRPGLDRSLEAICLQCLEKAPAARYPTARELADDLQRWLDGGTVHAKGSRGRAPLVAAVVGALALIGAGIAGVASLADDDAEVQPTIAANNQAPVETTPRPEPDRGGSTEKERERGLMLLKVPAQVLPHPECRGATLLPDGKRALTHGLTRKLLLWDLERGEVLRSWPWRAFRLVLRPDGETFVYAFRSKISECALDGRPVLRLQLGKGVIVTSLALSRDGSLLAIGTENHQALVVDTGTWEILHRLDGHGSPIHRVRIRDEGLLLSTCGGALDRERERGAESDNALRVWNLTSPDPLVRRIGLFGPPYGLDLSPVDRTFSVACDRRVMIYSASGVEPSRTFTGTNLLSEVVTASHRGVVRDLAYGPRGGRLLSVSGDFYKRDYNELRLWDVETGEELWRVGDLRQRVETVSYSATEDLVLVSTRRQAQLWDLSALRK